MKGRETGGWSPPTDGPEVGYTKAIRGDAEVVDDPIRTPDPDRLVSEGREGRWTDRVSARELWVWPGYLRRNPETDLSHRFLGRDRNPTSTT